MSARRISYAFTLATALVMSPLLAPVSTADPQPDPPPEDGAVTSASAAVSPSSATVTLITGDAVAVQTMADGRQSATVQPAVRADGHVPSFSQFVLDDQMYVIPDDAVKLVPDLLDRNLFNVSLLTSSGMDDASSDAVQVILQSSASPTSRRAPAVEDLPGVTSERTLESIDAVAASVDKQEANAFVQAAVDAGVDKVWLDAPLVPTDIDSAPQIGAPTAWEQGFTGDGVRIAVLDTGIDEAHPDLAGAVVAAQDFSGGGDPDDHFGHGTHVASIAAGRGVGNTDIRGMAHGADLINGKILNDAGSGELSWLIDGLEWASNEQDADIVNLSIGVRGYYTDGTDPWSEAINSVADQYGTLIVVAAGNDGAGGVNPPGTADLGLTVAAVDDDDQITPFSGRGPRAGDWALKPDVSAPGNQIIAARAGGTSMGSPVDDLYTAASGTSMATPHVAGAAALLLQQRPELTGQQVKSLLMGTAQPNGTAPVWHEGTGRIFVPSALEQTVWAEPGSLSMGYFPYPQDGPAVIQDLTYRNSGTSDVTLTLASEVTDEDGNAPAPGQFSVGGTSVVVPAGGTASVPVTVDPQAGEFGLFGGAITATDEDGRQVRTSVGWHKEPVRMQLTVDVTNRDGEPAGGLTGVDIMSVDDNRQYLEVGVPVVDGQASVRVPPGNYSVMAFVADYEPAGIFMDRLSSVMEPEVAVTADTTVVLDARDAAPATVDTGQPVEVTTQVMGQMRQDANGRSATHSWTTGPGYDLFASPTEAVTIGDFEYYTKWSLQKPLIQAETISPTASPIEASYASNSDKIDGVLETEMVYAGLGYPEDYAGIDVAGKVALIQRGELTFVDKVQNAKDAGAAAVLIYNNRPGVLFIGVNPDTLPTLSAEQAEGERLRAMTEQGPVTVRLTGTLNTPYVYDVIYTENPVPDVDELAYVADETNTVAINTDYRASTPDSPVGEVRHMWRPNDPFSFGFLRKHTAPTVRTEYVSTGDSSWAQYLYAYSTSASPFNAVMLAASETYPTAGPLSETWLHSVLRGGLKPYLGFPEGSSAYRDGDLMGIDSLSYADNAGHFSRPPAQEDSFSTQLYADGQLLLDQAGSGWAEVQVPAGQADYRLVADATRDQSWWTLSTHQHTEWEFSSDTTDGATVLPLLDVSMVPQQLDELNRATQRNTDVVMRVSHQEGSTSTAAVEGLRAWWSSDDGATWNSAKLGSKNGVWTATVKAPKGSGPISLKVEAWDAAGATVSQEVIRAYVALD